MGSYSLVKSYLEKDTVDEIIAQTIKQAKQLLGLDLDPSVLAKFIGEVYKHETTYPNIPWEPKESFRAVANYYAKQQAIISNE